MSPRWLLLPIFVALFAVGCPHPAPPPPVTTPQQAMVVPHATPILLDDGDDASLSIAVRESLAWLATQPPARPFVFGPRTVTAADEQAALTALATFLDSSPAPDALAAWVAARFDVLEGTGSARGDMMFTGYYVPALAASLTPSPIYSTPIYAPPDDRLEASLDAWGDKFKGTTLVGRVEGKRFIPYWTRTEIDAGHLVGHATAIAWAKDPVDLFFLQVQGSGVLDLPDGSEKRIGYAGSNGRPYQSIGSLMLREGDLSREQATMQSMKAWLAAHPEERARVLHFDDSYVFFRFLPGEAEGSLGRPVTGGRSIAIDPSLFPPAALAWVDTTRAIAGSAGAPTFVALKRFVLAQDTGGAIKGAGHVDFFWGRGADAELAAGTMKQPGRLFFLAPKAPGS